MLDCCSSSGHYQTFVLDDLNDFSSFEQSLVARLFARIHLVEIVVDGMHFARWPAAIESFVLHLTSASYVSTFWNQMAPTMQQGFVAKEAANLSCVLDFTCYIASLISQFEQAFLVPYTARGAGRIGEVFWPGQPSECVQASGHRRIEPNDHSVVAGRVLKTLLWFLNSL